MFLLSSVNIDLLLLQVVCLLLAGQLEGSPKPEISKLHSSKVTITVSLFHSYNCCVFVFVCFLFFFSFKSYVCLSFVGQFVYHFVGVAVCLSVYFYFPLFASVHLPVSLLQLEKTKL